LTELKERLEAVVDVNGERVIRNVYRSDQMYSGNATALAPDLIVGYARGVAATPPGSGRPGRSPTTPIAARVTDDQVGRQGRGVAGVHLVGTVDVTDHPSPLTSTTASSRSFQLGQQLLGLRAGLDDTGRARGP